ncbi:MAG: cytochrome c assembly protein, partial [Bacteroidota bacterium]
GDIAVGAIFSIQSEAGNGNTAQPIYFIRGSRPFNIKDEIPSERLHFRFVKIDPNSNSIDFMVAQATEKTTTVPVEIATDSKRADWIVLAAIEFPGINLFWLGSLLMLIGLTVSMFHRMRS